MEGSIKDHKGYLESYLKRAQSRSLKALQGGMSQGITNVAELGKELSRRASFVTHKDSRFLPIPVLNTSESDENGLKPSTALATEQGALGHTTNICSSAPMYVACVCSACASHVTFHSAAYTLHVLVVRML